MLLILKCKLFMKSWIQKVFMDLGNVRISNGLVLNVFLVCDNAAYRSNL